MKRVEMLEGRIEHYKKVERERAMSICIAVPPFSFAYSLAGDKVRMFSSDDSGPSTLEQVAKVHPAEEEEDTAIIELVHPEAKMPVRATDGSAGADLFSVVDIAIPSKKQGKVPLGLKITAPVGTYARVAPRSGLAASKMIDVGAGVIDRDYAGECAVIIFNHGE